jgi:hypothetical protein
VQVDSDTVFLQDPDFSLNGVDAAARPVDVKGMCTSGPGDPFDPYWRSLCRLCEVEYEQLPMVKTTVDRQVVRASYNGGLVAARRATGIFERTEEFFNRVVAAKLKPWGTDQRVKSGAGLVGTAGGAYWGTSQAALSLAITASGASVQLFPETYNIPLHLTSPAGFSEGPPIHVHYHWIGSAGEIDGNPMLDGRLHLPSETVDWLRERLPLRAEPAWWQRLFR